MPLEEFILECNHSIDCTPLTSMPLTNLALITASGTDLRPLLHITSLETFATNAQIDKLLPLRDHPSLKFINYRYEGVRPAADFWKEYDTQQEAKKK
jgi:hypothetical protein